MRGGGVRHGLWRAVRRRRRLVAAGLAVTAAALAAWAPRGTDRVEAHPAPAGAPEQVRGRAAPQAETVHAPVRIADAATVRLLRTGDRVDVIAAPNPPTGGGSPAARVVATGARVSGLPEPAGAAAADGALVVLAVPRSVAARLAGEGAASRLVVTLC
ncbi:hypothetical protein ACIQM4_14785 [Streptomyces sp. NPDC091272]|uniref:hypothetical protein n=1 Tax=Streptomyces sp. NPDC091272 TaxID=3365981 RepID=UPI0037F47A28